MSPTWLNERVNADTFLLHAWLPRDQEFSNATVHPQMPPFHRGLVRFLKKELVLTEWIMLLLGGLAKG